MATMHLNPAATARRAYVQALASGAKAHVAFDVACAALRVAHPDMRDDKLRDLVAHVLTRAAQDVQTALD